MEKLLVEEVLMMKHPIQCRRTGEEGMFLDEVIELPKEQIEALGGKNRELVMKFIRLGDIKVV